MTTLTTVSSLNEAEIFCMKLQSMGIKAFIPDQHTVSVQPFYSYAIGGIRIQVDESELSRARELLKNELHQAAKGMFECPGCKSDSVRYERVSKRFAFLTILFVGIPLLWLKRQFKCEACGHKWKEK